MTSEPGLLREVRVTDQAIRGASSPAQARAAGQQPGAPSRVSVPGIARQGGSHG